MPDPIFKDPLVAAVLHVEDLANPHETTAEQVGAFALAGNLDELLVDGVDRDDAAITSAERQAAARENLGLGVVSSDLPAIYIPDHAAPGVVANKLYSVATGILMWAGKRIALWLSTPGNSEVVVTNSSGYLATEARGTGFNLDVGTTAGTVATGNHTHDASAITTGTVATARLGSGTADDTKFLRGDQTWATVEVDPPALPSQRTVSTTTTATTTDARIDLDADGTGSLVLTLPDASDSYDAVQELWIVNVDSVDWSVAISGDEFWDTTTTLLLNPGQSLRTRVAKRHDDSFCWMT